MNPFELKPAKPEYWDFKRMYLKPYDAREVSPYTKVRIILMNGTEFEAVKFAHQFARHNHNNDIRRQLAVCRRMEQQQNKRLNSLKPIEESLLEHTMAYEQLAVDLTAALAKRESNPIAKQQMDFALLEDFDHVYRYANLLEMEEGVRAEELLGRYTEITPGRPTIAEHRHPFDDIKTPTCFKSADPLTRLNLMIITAAEQQTMNYYMNIGAFYHSDLGRKLYSEIGMIEEQHVSGYESLLDTECTWLENLLCHEYVECYLYYSMYEDESDPHVKKVFEQHFYEEVTHLHMAAEMLKKYEGKDHQSVIPNGKFPELLKLHENIDYIRGVLKTVRLTSRQESWLPVGDLPDSADFFTYQKAVIKDVEQVPSHAVISTYQSKNEEDYRFEVSPHPDKALRDRRNDNTEIARKKNA